MEKFIVLEVAGDASKNIVATTLLKPLQEKYPDRKIVIVADYPDFFVNNPLCYVCYKVGNHPNFYHTYIEGKDTIIIAQDPYKVSDYIRGKIHLSEAWFRVAGLEYDPKYIKPDIRLNPIYKETAQGYFKHYKKPLMVIETHAYRNDKTYNWHTDMPNQLVQNLIVFYQPDYDIIQITNHLDQRVSQHITTITQDNVHFLEMCFVLQLADKRILVDSFLQHVSAAWDLKSTVLWNSNHPNKLGYSIHDNVLPRDGGKDNFVNMKGYLDLFASESKDLSDFPYNNMDFFDLEEIKYTMMY